MDPQTPGLYIHIPFCLKKCPYCNFYSQADRAGVPSFIEALRREMEMAGPGWGLFDTVYIGGGTPSVLSPGELAAILAAVREFFSLAPDTEITLEANPGDLSLPFLQLLKNQGMTRLNLGVQSFDGRVLEFLERRHTVQQATQAVIESRQAGFDHIGLDLIYGVPGQSMESWRSTLSQAMAFSPEHLSCYQLTLEPDTPMGRANLRGDFPSLGEEELFQFFHATAQETGDAGYLQYEVSNFARGSQFFSRHNQKYWVHTPYLGLGPSAHSFSGRERWWNYASVDRYIEALRGGRLPVQERESLNAEQLRLEALFLGLRTPKGIDLESFRQRYQFDLVGEKKDILDRLREAGLIVILDGRLCPTRAGLAVADRLATI